MISRWFESDILLFVRGDVHDDGNDELAVRKCERLASCFVL